MLNGIPKIISPELIKIMMEMGHGDELVIADGNFPAEAIARRIVRADGHNAPELLNAILQFFPLDPYVKNPVALMAVVPGDDVKTPIWDEYRAIVKKFNPKAAEFEHVERFAFYERAKQAYAVLATGESALYANIILKKGVVIE
ncbi:MAG: L-fucose mutarotase [Bacteroidota bacterium]